MSEYSELVDKFFLKYERPIVEDLVVGFSGIDPPLKTSNAGVYDHEELENLLGGNVCDGHYHLTFGQLMSLREYMQNVFTVDGGYATTTEAEYEQTLNLWINGGGA